MATQLKVAYANALMASGGAPKIKGKGWTKKVKPVNTKVTVNGRGALIIPKALVGNMKIKEGQSFEVKKTGKRKIIEVLSVDKPLTIGVYNFFIFRGLVQSFNIT